MEGAHTLNLRIIQLDQGIIRLPAKYFAGCEERGIIEFLKQLYYSPFLLLYVALYFFCSSIMVKLFVNNRQPYPFCCGTLSL